MVQRLIVGIHQHHHVKETTPTGSVFFVACNYVWGLQLEGMSLTRMLNLDQLVPTKNLPTMILMNNDFNGLMPQGNNSFCFANANRSSAEGAAAVSQTEDAADTSQTVEAEDAATVSQTFEAEDASMHQAVDTNNNHKAL
ncbi:unnamed protein product [Brassica rapa subsp. narinosa]